MPEAHLARPRKPPKHRRLVHRQTQEVHHTPQVAGTSRPELCFFLHDFALFPLNLHACVALPPQKTGNAIRALGRMANLSASRRNSAASNSAPNSPRPSITAPTAARMSSLNEEDVDNDQSPKTSTLGPGAPGMSSVDEEDVQEIELQVVDDHFGKAAGDCAKEKAAERRFAEEGVQEVDHRVASENCGADSGDFDLKYAQEKILEVEEKKEHNLYEEDVQKIDPQVSHTITGQTPSDFILKYAQEMTIETKKQDLVEDDVQEIEPQVVIAKSDRALSDFGLKYAQEKHPESAEKKKNYRTRSCSERSDSGISDCSNNPNPAASGSCSCSSTPLLGKKFSINEEPEYYANNPEIGGGIGENGDVVAALGENEEKSVCSVPEILRNSNGRNGGVEENGKSGGKTVAKQRLNESNKAVEESKNGFGNKTDNRLLKAKDGKVQCTSASLRTKLEIKGMRFFYLDLRGSFAINFCVCQFY